MQTFEISYTADGAAVVSTSRVEAQDHWGACELGWSLIPDGADDFQVTELDSDALIHTAMGIMRARIDGAEQYKNRQSGDGSGR